MQQNVLCVAVPRACHVATGAHGCHAGCEGCPVHQEQLGAASVAQQGLPAGAEQMSGPAMLAWLGCCQHASCLQCAGRPSSSGSRQNPSMGHREHGQRPQTDKCMSPQGKASPQSLHIVEHQPADGKCAATSPTTDSKPGSMQGCLPESIPPQLGQQSLEMGGHLGTRQLPEHHFICSRCSTQNSV